MKKCRYCTLVPLTISRTVIGSFQYAYHRRYAVLREKWLYDNGSPFPNCHHRGKDKACKKYESGACVNNSSVLAHEGDGCAKLVGYATLRSEHSGLPLSETIFTVNSSI
jgi:hypothetical protein